MEVSGVSSYSKAIGNLGLFDILKVGDEQHTTMKSLIEYKLSEMFNYKDGYKSYLVNNIDKELPLERIIHMLKILISALYLKGIFNIPESLNKSKILELFECNENEVEKFDIIAKELIKKYNYIIIIKLQLALLYLHCGTLNPKR